MGYENYPDDQKPVIERFVKALKELRVSAEIGMGWLGSIVAAFIIFLTGFVHQLASRPELAGPVAAMVIVLGSFLVGAYVTIRYAHLQYLMNRIARRAVRAHPYLAPTAHKALGRNNTQTVEYLSTGAIVAFFTVSSLIGTFALANDWLKLSAAIILGGYVGYGLILLLALALTEMTRNQLIQPAFREWLDEPAMEKRKHRLTEPRYAVGDDGELVEIEDDEDYLQSARR